MPDCQIMRMEKPGGGFLVVASRYNIPSGMKIRIIFACSRNRVLRGEFSGYAIPDVHSDCWILELSRRNRRAEESFCPRGWADLGLILILKMPADK